jgi:hypothetical protein
MDDRVIENVIRRITTGFSFRFPRDCYRCGRVFEGKLISAIERAVMGGKTVIESIKEIRYDPFTENYKNPGESNYRPEDQPLAIGPRDICCRLSIVSPFIYPTGTNIAHKTNKRVVGTTVRTDPDTVDLFDYVASEQERPELVVDEEHGDIRLYIEDGIDGFEPPILWEDMDDMP